MSIIERFNKYQQFLKKWGVYDLKLGDWGKSMIETFLSKFTFSSEKLLDNTLIDFRDNFYTKNGFYLQKTSDFIEQHLLTIFDNYDKCPDIEIAKLLTDYCG